MRGIKLACRVISWVLIAVLVLILASNIYAIVAQQITGKRQNSLFGVSTAVVMSGSMSGTIEVNDMVLTCRQKTYQAGDVIMFDTGRSLVTHRITEQTEEGFITKGDANNVEDAEPVSRESVVGKVVLVIPKVGILIDFLRTPLGMLCIVLIGVLLLAWPSLFGGRKGKYYQGGNGNV